ncbi:NUDIX domain-containing protein [Pyruvatibacter sp.]|uniref:NUDIX hydrolase n=1 Tax=Pyruvatibacter sp. TaxID=1981328 RepID=UPI0032EE60DA
MIAAASSAVIRAASIAVMRDGDVLLVQRGRGAALGMWAFPGGRINDDETADEAALRELFEETGVTARITGVLGHYRFAAAPGATLTHLTVFRGTHQSGDARAGDDAQAVLWVCPQDASTLALADNMADALSRL